MQTKLELYTAWRDEAYAGLEKLNLDLRWLTRCSLSQKGLDESILNTKTLIDDQLKYLAFMEDMVKEEEGKLAK